MKITNLHVVRFIVGAKVYNIINYTLIMRI